MANIIITMDDGSEFIVPFDAVKGEDGLKGENGIDGKDGEKGDKGDTGPYITKIELI